MYGPSLGVVVATVSCCSRSSPSWSAAAR
jgi:hypothetical protein